MNYFFLYASMIHAVRMLHNILETHRNKGEAKSTVDGAFIYDGIIK